MKQPNTLFFSTIFIGVLIWFFFFVITPIEVIQPVSITTISFIIVNYLALIFGFITWPHIKRLYKKNENKIVRESNIDPGIVIKILLGAVMISFAFRYFDLFNVRGLSFNLPTIMNKFNADKPENYSLLLVISAIFRHLYFAPLIYYFASKTRNRNILLFCVVLFFLPLLESYLRGSRRAVFESAGLLFTILIVFGRINLKSYKTFLSFILLATILLVFSISVLQGRVQGDKSDFYQEMLNSHYNDFLPPSEKAIEFLGETDESLYKRLYFSELHIGQYVTHGVFEMDHSISRFPAYRTYGGYNFYLLAKALNVLKLTDIPLEKLNNPVGRNTYITFFGELYFDFGWLAVLAMFLFGALQRWLLISCQSNYLLMPIMVLLLFNNAFILIFSFIRAQFSLSIAVLIVFLILISIIKNKIISQGSNTQSKK